MYYLVNGGIREYIYRAASLSTEDLEGVYVHSRVELRAFVMGAVSEKLVTCGHVGAPSTKEHQDNN